MPLLILFFCPPLGLLVVLVIMFGAWVNIWGEFAPRTGIVVTVLMGIGVGIITAFSPMMHGTAAIAGPFFTMVVSLAAAASIQEAEKFHIARKAAEKAGEERIKKKWGMLN